MAAACWALCIPSGVAGLAFVTAIKHNATLGVIEECPQAKSEDQELCGHLDQCSEDPDPDGTDLDVAAARPAAFFALRLEPVQSGGAAAHESLHASRSDGWLNEPFATPLDPQPVQSTLAFTGCWTAC
jgi:hypothetical protein